MPISDKMKEIIEKEIADAEQLDERVPSDEDLHYQKKYLIDEVVDGGNELVDEMEQKKDIKIDYDSAYRSFVDTYYELNENKSPIEPPKKLSFWGRLMDFIFK